MEDEIYVGPPPVVLSPAMIISLAIIVSLSIVVSLAIIVPLSGVLVRFRANYNPKALQLDSEGGATAHTGPVVNSYFQMFARVYRIEGLFGLYKGLMPTAINTLVVGIVILLAVDTEQLRQGTYRAPDIGVVGTLFYSIAMMVISLPTSILTYRAITTPHKLGYFNLMGSLRILLTPTERRRPWILYLTPGLMAAEMSHIAVIVLILGPLRRLLLPKMSQPFVSPSDVSIWKMAIYFIIFFAAVAVLAPLEVIMTRLAIQRNHASAEYNSVAQEINEDGDNVAEYLGAEEDVIGLRDEMDPYLGLANCAKRIINEEGLMTLYRAWWITLLGNLGSAFA